MLAWLKIETPAAIQPTTDMLGSVAHASARPPTESMKQLQAKGLPGTIHRAPARKPCKDSKCRAARQITIWRQGPPADLKSCLSEIVGNAGKKSLRRGPKVPTRSTDQQAMARLSTTAVPVKQGMSQAAPVPATWCRDQQASFRPHTFQCCRMHGTSVLLQNHS